MNASTISKPPTSSGSPRDAVDALDLRRVWHPFTQMREYAAWPRVQIARGQGCWLEDVEGRRYLDANASIWTNVHGHADPELDAALTGQLGKIAHSTYLGLGHAPGAQLADKLCELTGLDRVFYSDNGSGAVEIAVKLSFQYFQLIGQPERKMVIALSNAYHGDTFGTMSLGDNGVFHERFDAWKFPVERIPAPRCEALAGEESKGTMDESLAVLDTLLAAHGKTVAAVIVEPWVQGAAGMHMQPKGFLRELEKRCRKHGAHLILDEVFVGFGRLGPMLVGREEGVSPDFYCLAKGLTAGYLPLAATVTSETIYEAFLGEYGEYKAFFHGHTFTGNPLACAVALKSIEKLERRMKNGEHAETLAAFNAFFRRLREALPESFGLRQRGFAGSLDLPAGDASKRRGMHVCLALRDRGILLRALADSLLIVPPLVISSDELDFLRAGILSTLHDKAYL